MGYRVSWILRAHVWIVHFERGRSARVASAEGLEDRGPVVRWGIAGHGPVRVGRRVGRDAPWLEQRVPSIGHRASQPVAVLADQNTINHSGSRDFPVTIRSAPLVAAKSTIARDGFSVQGDGFDLDIAAELQLGLDAIEREFDARSRMCPPHAGSFSEIMPDARCDICDRDAAEGWEESGRDASGVHAGGG